MHRVIAGISNFTDVGDTTTLASPEVADDICRHVQAEKVARGEAPRELSPQAMEEITVERQRSIQTVSTPDNSAEPVARAARKT